MGHNGIKLQKTPICRQFWRYSVRQNQEICGKALEEIRDTR